MPALRAVGGYDHAQWMRLPFIIGKKLRNVYALLGEQAQALVTPHSISLDVLAEVNSLRKKLWTVEHVLCFTIPMTLPRTESQTHTTHTHTHTHHVPRHYDFMFPRRSYHARV